MSSMPTKATRLRRCGRGGRVFLSIWTPWPSHPLVPGGAVWCQITPPLRHSATFFTQLSFSCDMSCHLVSTGATVGHAAYVPFPARTCQLLSHYAATPPTRRCARSCQPMPIHPAAPQPINSPASKVSSDIPLALRGDRSPAFTSRRGVRIIRNLPDLYLSRRLPVHD